MATKDPVLSVRLPDDLDSRLTKCAEKLDLSKNDIARHAIRAAVVEIESNGFKITLPLEMSVKNQPVKSAGKHSEKVPTMDPPVAAVVSGGRSSLTPRSKRGLRPESNVRKGGIPHFEEQ